MGRVKRVRQADDVALLKEYAKKEGISYRQATRHEAGGHAGFLNFRNQMRGGVRGKKSPPPESNVLESAMWLENSLLDAAKNAAKRMSEGESAKEARESIKAWQDQVSYTKKLKVDEGQYVSVDKLGALMDGHRAFPQKILGLIERVGSKLDAKNKALFVDALWGWVENVWNIDAVGDYSGLAFERRPSLSDWVRTLRFPPDSSGALYGQINFHGQEWIEEILENSLNPDVRKMVLMMAAQVGKTALLMMICACRIRWAATAIVWALPSDKLASSFSEEKLQPFLITANAELKNLYKGSIKKPKALSLPFKNARLSLVGAKIPANLSMRSAGLVIVDEADKIEHEDKRESHPASLLEVRQNSFESPLMVEASTPTMEGSYFSNEWLQSTQGKWVMPCIHCQKEIDFIWSRDTVRWERSEEKPSIESVKASAAYFCQECGGRIDDEGKFKMVSRGRWQHACEGRVKGYHINGLYSRFRSIGDIAAAFVVAARSVDRRDALRKFYNSDLGLPYEVYDISIDEDKLRDVKKEGHTRGVVPFDKVKGVFVGYDPGLKEVHWVACAYTYDEELYVIDWGTILRTESIMREGELHEGVCAHFKSLRWQGHVPAVGMVDSGYQTEKVYREVLGAHNLFASRGSSTHGTFYTQASDRSHGKEVYIYSDYALKNATYADALHAREGVKIWLPEDATEELIVGLSGQQLIKNSSGRQVWKELANDHFGDCLKLCMLSVWALRAAEVQRKK